jgi:hypothetical protein
MNINCSLKRQIMYRAETELGKLVSLFAMELYEQHLMQFEM